MRGAAVRRWYGGGRIRFSLRCFLLATVAASVWLGWLIHSANVQRHTVASLRAAGVQVLYDYQVDNEGRMRDGRPSRWLKWVGSIVGDDFVFSVRGVTYHGKEIWSDGVFQDVNKLKGLRLLYYPGGRIDDSGLRKLRKLGRLRVLSISGAAVTDNGIRVISGFRELRELHLDTAARHVTAEGMKALARMPNLRVLDLGSLKVDDRWLNNLSASASLRELHVVSEKVTDRGLRHLRRMQQLDFLRLWCTPITDHGLKELAHLSNLDELHLYGTRVTPQGVNALQQALPNCRIKVNQPY